MFTARLCWLLVLLVYKTKDCYSRSFGLPVEYFGLFMPYCKSHFCEKRCLDETVTATVKNKDTSNCLCDSVCIIYGDCCPDYYTLCLDGHSNPIPIRPGNYEWVANRVKTMSTSKSKFKFSMILFKHKMCSFVDIHTDPGAIWSIAECPQSYSDTSVSSKCHNPKADVAGYIPATHKMFKFINFRNIYCAICHGVSVSDLRIWGTLLQCLKHINNADINYETLPDYLNNGNCSLLVLPPNTTEVRSCHVSDIKDRVFAKRNSKEFVSNLHKTTIKEKLSFPLDLLKKNKTSNVYSDHETLLELCGSYRYMVVISCRYISRNVHCIQLENDTVPLVKYKCRLCSGNTINPPHHYVSLKVLFTFDLHGPMLCSSTACSTPEHISCEADEVYDYYSDRCQQLTCPVGKVPVNGSCHINGIPVRHLEYQIFPNGFHIIHLNITYLRDNYALHETKLLEVMRSSFQETSSKIYSGNSTYTESPVDMKPISKNYHGPKGITLEVLSSCLHCPQGTNSTNTSNNFRHSSKFVNVLVKVLSDYYHQGDIVAVTISTFSSSKDVYCKNNTHMSNQNGVLLESNETFFVYHHKLYYPIENIPFVIKVGMNDSEATLIEYAICEMDSRLLDCPMISYPENMTENQNTSVHILDTDLYFPLGSFVFQDSRVYVCSNFSRSYTVNETIQFFTFNPIQGILTLVCSLVSILSLTLTMIVYLILPDLRNVPGKIVMSLSFSLMTSQALLLLSNVATGIFCKVMGIVLHWTWLSTFVWMTIMATDMMKTFSGKHTTRQNQNIFSIYAAIALCVPALFVASCAAIDIAELPNMDIGYGDDNICWISNKKASLMVFGVPLAVLLLINVVCFVITICAIQRSMSISKTATSTRKDRIKCFIFSKLLVITGLTWTFGFVAAFFKFEELWYVFIILNGSQGLYILFCFVFNRRVLHLLKIRLEKTKHTDGLSNESRTLSTQM